MKQKTIYVTVTNNTLQDQRMQRVCNSLTENGYEVVLVGRGEGNMEIPGRLFSTKLISTFFGRGILFYLEFNIKLIIFLIDKELDAITSVDLDTIIAGRIVTLLKNKKLIFDTHEYFINVPELLHRPIKRWLWIAIEKVFVSGLSLAYTVNKSLAAEFTRRYHQPFHSIRNTPVINAKVNQPKSLSEGKVILIYQGALNVGRGLELYVEAMPSLPNCVLWICGRGDIEEELVKRIRRSGCPERIVMKGFIAPDQLMKITRNAHIGLNMLDPASKSYYHSLANRYFDYINAGIPAIHMDYPEYRLHNNEIETSVLINDYSTNDLIAAVNSLILHPEKYDRLAANCGKAKFIFNWNHESKKLISLYDSVLYAD